MLSPEPRAVAIDFLRPPPGYVLDVAVLTTFSLDLEALLALPLAVLAHADGGVEEVLADPLLLLSPYSTYWYSEQRNTTPKLGREISRTTSRLSS
jgi:hypothetical protein